MTIKELKGKTVALLASGGLDSCTITKWLSMNGVRVICITVDLGQPDEPDLEAVRERLLKCGAEEALVIDAKEDLAQFGLIGLMAQARYEGDYWNTTGIARYVTVEAALKQMALRKIGILAHGATGRGNDQVRFQLATNMLQPNIEIYAPWRDRAFLDMFGGRKEMIDFCESNGVPIVQSHAKSYSTDSNLLGLTHEAGALESLETSVHFVEPEMGVLPVNAPDRAESFSVEFEKGIPVAIDGVKVSELEAFKIANLIGGRNAIGICTHLVENRFVGIKSRGVYEAPGMELLGKCFEFVLQTTLDRRARELYDSLSSYIGKQIYEGYLLSPGGIIAMSSVRGFAALVSGKITVQLYKGNISFHSFEASETEDLTLYSAADSSMEKEGSFDHADSEGFLRVLGVTARKMHRQTIAMA
ncbi:MAG: argininosuccinate synthase [Candidatus Moranbacteria bacterium]|nr:argininosuccinate synthase [Candidatus Moranbacteria bacterium]